MTGIHIEKDVPIPMQDGLKLSGNVYRPETPGKYPAIMAFTAFGKDDYWQEKFPGWGQAYEPWSPTITGAITFEANDPEFWVPYGYVLVIVDPRGLGRSPGQMRASEGDGAVGEKGILEEGLWARDMYDAIEWAGAQDWSNGNIALSGVSILGFTQWRAAGLNPPHLKAINPWEAMTDFYRDVMFPGGIPETRFSQPVGYPAMTRALHNPAWPSPEKEAPSPPVVKVEDDYLADITVPTLICATWSDIGCHTRGSFRAFRKISSRHKWLYIHGRQKWGEFYGSEARAFRKMFFDHFLKDQDDRILTLPRVRMEVRETLDAYTVRWEEDFPVPRTQYKKLYLDATDDALRTDNTPKESIAGYDSADGKACFDLTLEDDTELTGYMNLKLWVSTDGADDMDLFVTIRKLDRDGKEVFFDGWAAQGKMPAAIGWLRLSLRKLDKEKSTPWEPYPETVVGAGEKVKPGDVVPCEIPILPSGTLFRKGETLRLEVSGRYRGGEDVEVPYAYDDSVNKGRHAIHTGGGFESYLLVPLV